MDSSLLEVNPENLRFPSDELKLGATHERTCIAPSFLGGIPHAFLTLSGRRSGILDVTVGAGPTQRGKQRTCRVSDERERYMSYLLRLWQTTSGNKVVWRASLENSQTGERRGFASLDALLRFLRQTTDTETEQSEHDKE